MGNEMFNCWAYDSNETQCDNQTQCSWMQEPVPFCDMNMKVDCMQYSWNETDCVADGNCSWAGNNWCDMKVMRCFWNATLSNNQSLCDAEPGCNWSSWNSCEPSIFNVETSTDCSTEGGLWRTGWCNPAGDSAMFGKLDMKSPPVMLGHDSCPETGMQGFVDICGAGVKDDWDIFGLGIGVTNIKDAAMCNGIKTFNGVGDGQENTSFYWYIDSDGSSTGGCALYNDALDVGWDVFVKYLATYNNGQISETKSISRCVSGEWKPADIKLSSWKEKMCNELQGGMIALSKDDFSEYDGLFNSSADLRFHVATANASSNMSSPSDELGPLYYAQGTIDFVSECCWSTADPNIDCDGDGLSPINDPDCADIIGKGYIPFEDCFGNGIDEDGDGLVDCWDLECKGHPYCVANALGVESVGYVDYVAPRLKYFLVEKYPDSALVTFDTDEPANGSLYFYYNNSLCSGTNRSILDIGLTDATLEDYKKWHAIDVYNDSGVTALNDSLTANTTYYYKLSYCDSSNNCGTSACANFTTSPSVEDCKKCDFIFNMDLPLNWLLDIDTDTDGVYEVALHRQCGAGAGVQLNYTQARTVNMKFTDNISNASIYLLNARITRTLAHNPGMRDLSGASGMKSGTTSGSGGANIGYGGFSKNVSDKLVEKFNPRSCMMQIPGTGTCDILYHCDDNFENCVDRTADATLNETGTDYCLWEIPCHFSVWAGGLPSSPTTTTSSSSSGSSGGDTATLGARISAGGDIILRLGIGDSELFNIDKVNHTFKVSDVTTKAATFTIDSSLQSTTLKIGESRYFDFTNDETADIAVTLISILNYEGTFKINKSSTPMPKLSDKKVEEKKVEKKVEEKKVEKAPVVEKKPGKKPFYKNKIVILVAALVVLLLIILLVVFLVTRK